MTNESGKSSTEAQRQALKTIAGIQQDQALRALADAHEALQQAQATAPGSQRETDAREALETARQNLEAAEQRLSTASTERIIP